MVSQVVRGIQTLHESGVFWFDGKPGNCLVDIVQDEAGTGSRSYKVVVSVYIIPP